MDAIHIIVTIGTTHAPIATLKIEAIIQYAKRQKSMVSSILYPCRAIGARWLLAQVTYINHTNQATKIMVTAKIAAILTNARPQWSP